MPGSKTHIDPSTLSNAVQGRRGKINSDVMKYLKLQEYTGKNLQPKLNYSQQASYNKSR
jgi:hypothetical protein